MQKPVSPEALKDVSVKALACPQGRARVEFAVGQGLYVDVLASGHKSWVFRYCTKAGKHRRVSLGTYPTMRVKDAVLRFRELKLAVQLGRDPWEEQHQAVAALRAEPTVADVAREYLDLQDDLSPRTRREYVRVLAKDVLPLLGGRRASTITKLDVTLLLDTIVRRGSRSAADHTRRILAAAWNFCMQRGTISGPNPATGHRKRQTEKHTRPRRALTSEELCVLWHHLEAYPPPVAVIIRLLILTGARVSEVAELAWAEVDLERGVWRLPATRSKNGKTHLVPLSPLAVELLRGVPVVPGRPWVFPTPHKAVFSRQRAAGIPEGVRGALDVGSAVGRSQVGRALRVYPTGVGDVVPHDLRHTVATHLTRLGVWPHVTSAVLNHAQESWTLRQYGHHDFEREKREALVLWEQELRRIIAGDFDRVVALHPAR